MSLLAALLIAATPVCPDHATVEGDPALAAPLRAALARRGLVQKRPPRGCAPWRLRITEVAGRLELSGRRPGRAPRRRRLGSSRVAAVVAASWVRPAGLLATVGSPPAAEPGSAPKLAAPAPPTAAGTTRGREPPRALRGAVRRTRRSAPRPGVSAVQPAESIETAAARTSVRASSDSSRTEVPRGPGSARRVRDSNAARAPDSAKAGRGAPRGVARDTAPPAPRVALPPTGADDRRAVIGRSATEAAPVVPVDPTPPIPVAGGEATDASPTAAAVESAAPTRAREPEGSGRGIADPTPPAASAPAVGARAAKDGLESTRPGSPRPTVSLDRPPDRPVDGGWRLALHAGPAVGVDEVGGAWLGGAARGELEGARLGGWLSVDGAARAGARASEAGSPTGLAALEVVAGAHLRFTVGPGALRPRLGAGVALLRAARANPSPTCTTPACERDGGPVIGDDFAAWTPRPRLALGVAYTVPLSSQLGLTVDLAASLDPQGAPAGPRPTYADELPPAQAEAFALANLPALRARLGLGLSWSRP